MLRTLNLDVTNRSNWTGHGGLSKAVYAYLVEHGEGLRGELPGLPLEEGMFGENFLANLFRDGSDEGPQRRLGTPLATFPGATLPI
jgi:MOSC domain-containing protein YiiM